MSLENPRAAVALAVLSAVAAVAGITLGVTTLLGVTFQGDDPAAPASVGQGGWTIEDARQFTDFPLYWLGESYDGFPLRKIIRYRPENIVLFIYGSCTPPPGGGCAPPLSIRVEPYCMKPPERFAPSVRGEPLEVRGAPAEQIAGDLRIWTGEVSVKIFTAGLAAQVEAGENLRLVSEGPAGALKPLGPSNVDCWPPTPPRTPSPLDLTPPPPASQLLDLNPGGHEVTEAVALEELGSPEFIKVFTTAWFMPSQDPWPTQPNVRSFVMPDRYDDARLLVVAVGGYAPDPGSNPAPAWPNAIFSGIARYEDSEGAEAALTLGPRIYGVLGNGSLLARLRATGGEISDTVELPDLGEGARADYISIGGSRKFAAVSVRVDNYVGTVIARYWGPYPPDMVRAPKAIAALLAEHLAAAP